MRNTYKVFYVLKRVMLILFYTLFFRSVPLWGKYGGILSAIYLIMGLWISYWLPRKVSKVYEPIEWELRCRNHFFQFVKEYVFWELPLGEKKIWNYRHGFMISHCIILSLYGIFCYLQGPQNISTTYNGSVYYGYPHYFKFTGILAIWILGGMFFFLYLEERDAELLRTVSRKNWNPFIHRGVRRRLADQFKCKWSSFAEVDSQVQTVSDREKYSFWKEFKWKEDEYSHVYIREYKDKVALDIIEVIRLPEMENMHLECLQMHYQEMLEEYFAEMETDTDLTYLYIFCVDKITPAFRELIDRMIVERRFKSFLPTGICFNEGKAYIPLTWNRPEQEHKYLDLRRKFFKIIY